MKKPRNPYLKSGLTLIYPALVILFSLGVLIGWYYDIERLKRILPAAVSMNPLTALLFLACSLVIIQNFLLRKVTQLTTVLAIVVFVIAVLKLFSYFGNYEFQVDQFLFSSKLESDRVNGIPNQMAPNTAFNFSMVGLALLSYRTQGKWHLLSDILALIVTFTAFLSLVGYFYDAKALYGVPNYIPMAVPTALCFLLITIAILLNRKRSFLLHTLVDHYSGSRMARYLLPIAIILPVILGLLRLYGQEAGLYSSNFGTALFAAVNSILFIIFILKSASSINKSDAALRHEIEERKSIEARLRESEALIIAFNRQLERKVEERTSQLERNSKMFRSLIENSIDVIATLDAEARFTYSSVAMEKLSGYKPDAILKTRAFALVHADDMKATVELFQRVLTHPHIAFSTTIRILHKTGECRWVEGTIINLLDDVNVKSIVMNFHDITEKRKAEETKLLLEKTLLQEKIDRQIQVTQATINGQERERKEIGMELHDNVNQILAVSKLYLDLTANDAEHREEMISKSKEGILHAIQEIRRLSKSMVPPALGALEMVGSIRDFAEVISRSSGLHVDIRVPQEIMHSLDEHERLALYRIIQEQLNNVVKHAQARKAMIILSKQPGTAILTIKDDGKGFKINGNRAGIGLSNIQTRTEMLLGKFDLHSAPGKGCELTIALPLYE